MKLRISKKNATKLSSLINSLLVNQGMVDRHISKCDTRTARQAMTWYDKTADQLIEMGISVNKYGS